MSHSYHPKYGPVLSDEYGLDFGCDAFENSGPRRTSIYSENASYALSLQPTLEFYDIFNPTQTACVTYGASDNDNSFKHERPNSTTSLQMTNTGLSTRWQETNSTGQASGLSHFDAEVSHMFSPTSNNARCQSDSFLLGPTEDRRTAGNSRALPTGSGQVGSFLSNTLLPDTYRQPKRTPATALLFGSNVQDVFNDCLSMGSECIDVGNDDMSSFMTFPVQPQQVVLPPNSMGSQPDVTDCLDWLIEPEIARSILLNESVSTVEQPFPVAHFSKFESQRQFTEDRDHVQPIQLFDARVINSDTSLFSQVSFGQARAECLSVLPIPVNLARFPVEERDFLLRAFTEQSVHPSVALRALLDYVLPSAFLSDQVLEPLIADKHNSEILERIIRLPQCPPISFSNSKLSLFTLFVDKASKRCLFCGSRNRSIPHALGCVRRHLGHKPFKCAGCLSCNSVKDYSRFYTQAGLTDHESDKAKRVKCPGCGLTLRRDGMSRHLKKMHKEPPIRSNESPRDWRSARTLDHPYTCTSVHSDDVEEKSDHLMDCESD